MLYVIEGLDGTGKTTLAAELSHILCAPVLKTGADDSHNDYVDDLIVARTIGVCQPERDIILDRSIFSGMSYAAVKPLRSWALLKRWLEALNDIPVTVIHLVAEESVRNARDPKGRYASESCNLDADIAVLVKSAQMEGYAIAHKVFDTGRMQTGHIIDKLFRK